MITKEHKAEVANGLAEKLEGLAIGQKFPVDVDELIRDLAEAKSADWINSMLRMCTNHLYIFKDGFSGKYMLSKKTS